MPHFIRESHLEDICAQCKKPHGNNIILKRSHFKVYEIIICQNCGYEITRTIPEKEFLGRLKPDNISGRNLQR
jgi:hypothetical protein